MATVMRVFLMMSIVLAVVVVGDRRPFDPSKETITEYKEYLTKQIQDERDARSGSKTAGSSSEKSEGSPGGETTTAATTTPTTAGTTEKPTTEAPTTTEATEPPTTETTKATTTKATRSTPTPKTTPTKPPTTTTRSLADADTVFMTCCKSNPKVLPGCYKYCNYESWSMAKLQQMYLAKDCGPGSIQSFIVCGSHELDNTECCEKANVNAPNLPKECMNMCHSDLASVKMSMKYLPCMNKLSSFRDCYLSHVQASIDSGDIKVE